MIYGTDDQSHRSEPTFDHFIFFLRDDEILLILLIFYSAYLAKVALSSFT